jgi:two-component system, NtrC family, sensor kinase
MADGTDFPVEVTLNPIKLKDKNTLLVVWHDLTEIKQKENALQQSNAELAYTLTDLRETQTQLILSEKMASLGQLIASVAHEINTPLGAIRSSVENVIGSLAETMVYFPAFVISLPNEELNLFLTILEQTMSQKVATLSTREARKIRMSIASELHELQVEQSDELAELLVDAGIHNLAGFEDVWKSEKAGDIVRMVYKMVSIRRSAENIQEATERASKIIFALKNFSRQDHSGEKVPTNINDSLETVLTLYQNQIKQGIEVGKHFADLPEVLCYPDELIQVWTNLIHNAIQAMGGKGTLSIATKLVAEKLQVSIQDTGAGIPADIQDKIFNAFFTTKKLGEGSGLGLDIVRKIINKHAGKIWFETEVGKGTTFFVELPI